MSLGVVSGAMGSVILWTDLGSPLRLIANNSGTNGAVVMQKVGVQGVTSCRRAWGLGGQVKQKDRCQVLGFRVR